MEDTGAVWTVPRILGRRQRCRDYRGTSGGFVRRKPTTILGTEIKKLWVPVSQYPAPINDDAAAIIIPMNRLYV